MSPLYCATYSRPSGPSRATVGLVEAVPARTLLPNEIGGKPYACRLLSSEPTYTKPSTTTGEDRTAPPVVSVHNGAHTFGVPLQFVLAVASSPYNLVSSAPTYNTPPTTAGDDTIAPPRVAVHCSEPSFALCASIV